MHAHRVRVHVSKDHELRVTLPSDFPAGEADVIVIEAQGRRLTVDELLASRLDPPPGVSPVTRGDIAAGARSSGGV